MIEIFQYDFIIYSLLTGILSGISCALLSNLIVLKKMEFIGDGAAHASFGGIAFAILMGWNLNIVGIITASIFASIIYLISKKQKIHENSIIGMLLSLSMALGVIFLYIKPGYTPEISSYLFGDILMVNKQDVILLSTILIIIIFSIILFNKEIKYFTFNQRMAKIYGVPVSIINFIFLLTVSIVVVTSVKIVGIILVTSLLITPGVISKMWAKTLNQMFIISSFIGFFSSSLGIIISYYLNIPSGPSIVVTLFTMFIFSYILNYSKKLFS
ncbi:metal ABC transporter permease [Oceanotoga sp. DSM 15011]|jgi:zinc transport system permease protein|uniref:metal ABC transporter permease n=1 Tax=unclassified Oceanotoga TaxID=2618448 RepID=UPI0021F3CEA8|nr:MULTISPECIES: metal ABC transporter permease [unclassified Oceanotoga]MDN5342509.1 zinc transport system permease protein [Oceanotoga sp.]UYO99475.1 metal ABC transporter permease [Oceanotoga sp. DSM 15011]